MIAGTAVHDRLDAATVREAGRGRWRDTIYPALGIHVGKGKHMPCPHCGGKDRFRCDDQDGSGSYICNQCGAGDGFSLVMKVRHCDFPEALKLVAEKLPIQTNGGKPTMGKPVAIFDYVDENGVTQYQVRRHNLDTFTDDKQDKVYLPWRPDGKGDWIPGLGNVHRILYRLPNILQQAQSTIIIHEGEGCVDAAIAADLPGCHTTTVSGSNAAKKTDFSPLKGRDVVIVPDNDESGERYLADVALLAKRAGARTIRALRLPNLPPKGDVKEWLQAGGTPEQFDELLAQAVSVEAAQGLLNEPTILIPLDTPIPPPMPVDVLPSPLNDMVQAVASHTETPPELAAGFGLSAVATACQQRIIVQVESGYTEPMNIWPTTALESGNRKTAVMMPMVAPLIDAERQLCGQMKEKILTAESERETIRAKIKALREATAKKKGFEDFEDKKQEIAKLESTMPEVPILPRLWVQDITPEKLGQVMAENKERLALISDEGGLFDTLAGRYSNGIPNLDLFLQAHAGSPVRVHRGSRPDVVMDRPALTIALSPQPIVLQGLATQPGFRGRGLLARFLYAFPVSRLGYRTLTSQPIPPSVKKLYQETITTLLKIEPVKDPSGQLTPHVLTLSPDAHAEWKEFQRTVEEKMRDGGDYEHIRDWAGKLPGAAARLAGLLHCAEHAETLPANLTITITTMQRALALAAFYQAHALVAFDIMGADPDLEKARHVWRWVERVQKKEFTARDCFQALRGTYKRMEQLNPAFPVLLERGYLIAQELSLETAGKPGPKPRVFRVNPLARKEHHD